MLGGVRGVQGRHGLLELSWMRGNDLANFLIFSIISGDLISFSLFSKNALFSSMSAEYCRCPGSGGGGGGGWGDASGIDVSHRS